LIETGAPIPLNVATTAPEGSEPLIIVLAGRVVISVVIRYMLRGSVKTEDDNISSEDAMNGWIAHEIEY
jgi:hypothetical protein